MAVSDPSDKQQRIIDAALSTFSAYGFARTSMADIAKAADMSRPALYQHYANKEEIFRAMLSSILEGSADNALAALDADVALIEQLDGFLQRWSGDLTEALRASQHGADMIEAKAGHAKPVVDAANKRVRDAVTLHLRAASPDRGQELSDLLLLSSIGLKYDEPSMPALRRRLRTLAETIALSASSG